MVALAVVPCLAQEITNIGCFSTGSTESCTTFIDQFCGDTSGLPVLPEDNVSMCIPGEAFPTGLFTAFREQFTTGILEFNADNCVPALQAVETACALGGSARVSGDDFFFTVQATSANCDDTTALV
ncbi:hypothetical protein NM688_g986 [Phlebia brevispora]|uniref:Uncharacterized protein n=1 Tax=Phlebia brevispora TaxID=194682 RepID=A0ACC1TCW0_9APHY|nr:hypothetical protein NM688_g986 [Phlebia brevispora]